MTNGFYNSNKLTKAKKRAFIKDAIGLSYNISCQSKYSPTAPFKHRGIDKRLNLNSSLEILFCEKDSILDCVDRYEYNGGSILRDQCEYEICFHTLFGPNKGWLLVYIFVNEESFKTLINKYNLSLTDW